jgi:ribose 5-phosphate isomerase RpiB
MVEVWLGTDFAGGRHLRRVRKIEAIEEQKDPTAIKNNHK